MCYLTGSSQFLVKFHYLRPNLLLKISGQYSCRHADWILGGCVLLFLLCWLQNLERAQQALVDAHHGAGVVKLAAVVGGTKQSDELALREELVAIFDDLMGTADEVHVVLLEETRNNVGAKGERDTTVVFAPSGNVLVGVGPQQVTKKTAVGDLKVYMSATSRRWAKASTYISRAHNTSDLLHRVEVRAQATMHGEDLLVDDGGNGQAVEAVGEGLPQLDVIPSLALIIETVDAVDTSTLVVTAQNKEVLGVLDLVGEEQADGLERLLATVDVVTKEEVVGLWREATVLEQTEEIVVLAVDVTADLDASGGKQSSRGRKSSLP